MQEESSVQSTGTHPGVDRFAARAARVGGSPEASFGGEIGRLCGFGLIGFGAASHSRSPQTLGRFSRIIEGTRKSNFAILFELHI